MRLGVPALVTLLRAEGDVAASTTSDAAGRFTLAAPQPGRYLLRVERLCPPTRWRSTATWRWNPVSSGVVYYAPDAAVLLSEVFLDQHCFRLRAGGRAQPGMIGLAIEPVRDSQVPDIRGVLWLDARTAELRHLEFSYTGMRGASPDRMGGSTSRGSPPAPVSCATGRCAGR